jgi:hypothetical protein
MKIRKLISAEYCGRKIECVIRQVSADATISAELFESVIRLIVKGPTEDFEVDCQSFDLGEIEDAK